LWVGDLAAAERYVEMLLYHSTRHGLARWRTFGRCYLGIISIRQGNGSGLLRVAFSEPTAAGPAPWLWTLLISAVSDHADQIADGLPAIEEAIVHFEHAEERWVIAELLRVKGELLLWRGLPGAAAIAEGHFRQALEVARQQGALSWELRAATSLARLARSNEARELLVSVHDRFTEGFATTDLRAARSLIEDMS
jgi:hypothetical protein